MDFILTVLKIGFTLLLATSFLWTLLPWAFGVGNFYQKYGPFLGSVGFLYWGLLLIAHGVAFYLAWFRSGSILWLTPVLVVAHVVFGYIFGRNLSAA